ncbi:hypothetical protein [Chelativorans intermedius]|uniref:Uncharacterized protein n=1 Tax=Chelativorans intermedius TaxID=515947 RepID=A0ABV6D6F6_9HYPH|nr:hypothetical protein [Chelativorans intermedius]MCT8999463.1 hypothetical protein [Chelativorans intermedius]
MLDDMVPGQPKAAVDERKGIKGNTDRPDRMHGDGPGALEEDHARHEAPDRPQPAPFHRCTERPVEAVGRSRQVVQPPSMA